MANIKLSAIRLRSIHAQELGYYSVCSLTFTLILLNFLQWNTIHVGQHGGTRPAKHRAALNSTSPEDTKRTGLWVVYRPIAKNLFPSVYVTTSLPFSHVRDRHIMHKTGFYMQTLGLLVYSLCKIPFECMQSEKSSIQNSVFTVSRQASLWTVGVVPKIHPPSDPRWPVSCQLLFLSLLTQSWGNNWAMLVVKPNPLRGSARKHLDSKLQG